MKSISELVKLVNGLPWACTPASTYTNSLGNLRRTGGKTRRLISMLVLPGLLPPFEGMRQHFGRFLTELLDRDSSRPSLWSKARLAPDEEICWTIATRRSISLQIKLLHLIEYFSTVEMEAAIIPPIQTFLSHRFIFHLCQSNLRLSWSLQLAALQLRKSFVTFQFRFGEPDQN